MTRGKCAHGRRQDARRIARRPARRDGFTLVEVLVALFVLSLGAASLLSLYGAAAATHRRAAERTQAALFAEDVLATARVIYRPGMGVDDVIAAVGERLPAESGSFKYELRVDRLQGEEWSADELLARVRVRWRHERITAGANPFDGVETYTTILLPRARPGQAPDLEASEDSRSRMRWR